LSIFVTRILYNSL